MLLLKLRVVKHELSVILDQVIQALHPAHIAAMLPAAAGCIHDLSLPRGHTKPACSMLGCWVRQGVGRACSSEKYCCAWSKTVQESPDDEGRTVGP